MSALPFHSVKDIMLKIVRKIMDNKDFLEKLDTKIEDLNKQMLEQKEKEWVKIRAAWKAVNEVHAQLQIERAFARSIIIIAIVCIICSIIIFFKFF